MTEYSELTRREYNDRVMFAYLYGTPNQLREVIKRKEPFGLEQKMEEDLKEKK